MSFFPFISVPDTEVTTETPLTMYREIAWDYKLDEPVLVNGELLVVEGNEAIKVWCYKALKTERFIYDVYTWNHGTELDALIGKPYSKELIKAEATRYIQEALLINEYILDVNVLDVSFEGDTLTAQVSVTTIYGEVDVVV